MRLPVLTTRTLSYSLNGPTCAASTRTCPRPSRTGGLPSHSVPLRINDITDRGPGLQFSTTGAHSTLQNNLYGVQINQALFRGGRTVAQTQQAINEVESERAHLESIEQSVLIQAVTDYVDDLLYQADLDLNFNNEQVLRRQLEATRDRFEVGEVTRTDVSQAEASYAPGHCEPSAGAGQFANRTRQFSSVISV